MWELDSLEPTAEFPHEAIQRSLSAVYQRQIDSARETGILKLMERAENRVKEEIERRKDIWNEKLALRAKLRETLDTMENLVQNSALDDREMFHFSDHQMRKMEEAREKMERAAEAIFPSSK